MRRLLAFLSLVASVSCAQNLFPTEPSNPANESYAASLGIDIGTMQKTESGVYYRDSVVGSGTTLTSSTVSAVYEWIGYLRDGSPYGVSGAGGDTVQFANGMLPQGIKDGMDGMRVGGKRVIVVPSALAYGSSGAGFVPPNNTIIVSIHLLDVAP